MKHLSLFSGIGGFDLAAQWMGWDNVAHCEWNHFGRKILNYYWPNAISYEDITKTDFSIHRGTIDIVTGGFPCQPYSVAGKRKGKEDERHLWPEMRRAYREIACPWLVGENVRGLINWDGGLVFDEVQADLEADGYEVLPFLLPACGVDAPHRRDRIWFIAYSDSCANLRESRKNEEKSSEKWLQQRDGIWKPTKSISFREFSSNANCSMRKGRESRNETENRKESIEKQSRGYHKLHRTNWEKFPLESPLCNGNDGISSRLDGITFPKWRNESIKAGGNAIVPQVAYQIFKAIEQYNAQETN